ncbi:alpha/beta hydrolase [Altererythrobacter sp. FM1]|nr:alpha/beta hydrolase [Altererythrobacter sp. FM1]
MGWGRRIDMTRQQLAIALAVSTITLSSCASAQPTGLEASPSRPEQSLPDGAGPVSAAYKDIVYRSVDGRDLHLDLYTSSRSNGRASPVLVYFHGGAWARGQRPESWRGYSRYLEKGYAVITVQYRLAGEAKAPAAVQDARCALHWVAENADRYGFDREKIVAHGTSAGGHLALMASYLEPEDGLDPSDCKQVPQVAAVLDFYGPTNLAQAYNGATGRHSSVVRWVGDYPGAREMDVRMSPITYVGPAVPPTMIVHGDHDEVVTIEQSRELLAALKKAKVPTQMVVVPGGGHGKFPASEKKRIAGEVDRFLSRNGIN